MYNLSYLDINMGFGWGGGVKFDRGGGGGGEI